MPEDIDNELEILEKFIYDNPELEKLEELAGEFNIFTALNLQNNEIRHSTFLAWLLDPSESHGLGDYFLSIFLKEVAHKAYSTGINTPSVFDIDSWNFDDAEIIKEWRNIDILVKSEYHKFVCIIENKISSTEHGSQLHKYWEVIQSEFPTYSKLFIYLTVDGEEPSDEKDKEHYVSFSHGDIATIIEHLIDNKKEKLGTAILTFILHYRDMLRRYIMEDSEIQTICRSIYKKHKKALDLIFEYKPDRLMEIYECIKEIIETDENLILDYSTKAVVRFIPKNLDFIPPEGDWLTSKRMLIFELARYPKDLTLYLVIYPGPKEIRDRIHSLARKDKTLFNMARDKYTDRFTGIYKKQILRSSEYEDKDIKEIKELLKERIQDFKENDLPKIVNVLKQFEVPQNSQKE